MNKVRGELRSFVNAGLSSWQKEDIEEGKANLLWSKLAQEDWRELQLQLQPKEKLEVEALLASLSSLPQQVPNVADSMLDMEGIRCVQAGKVLIFYRYNSAFNLVDIVRVAAAKKAWVELLHKESD